MLHQYFADVAALAGAGVDDDDANTSTIAVDTGGGGGAHDGVASVVTSVGIIFDMIDEYLQFDGDVLDKHTEEKSIRSDSANHQPYGWR